MTALVSAPAQVFPAEDIGLRSQCPDQFPPCITQILFSLLVRYLHNNSDLFLFSTHLPIVINYSFSPHAIQINVYQQIMLTIHLSLNMRSDNIYILLLIMNKTISFSSFCSTEMHLAMSWTNPSPHPIHRTLSTVFHLPFIYFFSNKLSFLFYSVSEIFQRPTNCYSIIFPCAFICLSIVFQYSFIVLLYLNCIIDCQTSQYIRSSMPIVLTQRR